MALALNNQQKVDMRVSMHVTGINSFDSMVQGSRINL